MNQYKTLAGFGATLALGVGAIILFDLIAIMLIMPALLMGIGAITWLVPIFSILFGIGYFIQERFTRAWVTASAGLAILVALGSLVTSGQLLGGFQIQRFWEVLLMPHGLVAIGLLLAASYLLINQRSLETAVV